MKRYENTLASLWVVSIMLFTTLNVKPAIATIASDSYIINMGVTPQTIGNGLKPYGLIYDLVNNYQVPVIWSINAAKTKDGIDFSYNGTDYKGGTFVIPGEYIDASITSVITNWESQGVVGTYTTSQVSVPIYDTIEAFPILVIDQQSSGLIIPFFTNAGVSSDAYIIGTPDSLDLCDDIYAMPHADPTWANHGYLYNYVTVQKGWFWASCHAVSVLESVSNPNPPYQQLNFLSINGLQCYSSGSCNGITENHASSATYPVTYTSGYGDHPVMQFMNRMDSTTHNGSERWYIPTSTGQWRTTTVRFVQTSDGSSPGEGALLAFGPAFGDSSNGFVLYTAGHDQTKGPITHQVAAQRVFFNFLLYSVASKGVKMNSNGAIEIYSGTDSNYVVTPSNGVSPYTYSWTSTCSGTFSNPNDSQTTFRPDTVSAATNCRISVVITDNCGRKAFHSWSVTVYPPPSMLPIELIYFTGYLSYGKIYLQWITRTEKDNAWFEIQRSAEGRYFKSLGLMSGTGNSNQINYYSWTDTPPAGFHGRLYYRLRQIDYNGKSSYSWVIPVDVGLNPVRNIWIYPNPATQQLNINLVFEKATAISLAVYNITGQLMKVMLYNTEIAAGTFQGYIPLDNIPSGKYVLRITAGDEIITRNFLINR